MGAREIQSVHGERDTARNRVAIRNALLAFCGIALVALGGVVFSLIWRDATHMHNPNETASQLLTIGITLAAGFIILFLWGMKMTPLLCYRKYLRETSVGLSREVEGVIVRFDDEATFRDGLYFYACVVNVGNPDAPEDERLLYWDARLKRPGLAPGDKALFRAHGNDIIGMAKETGE